MLKYFLLGLIASLNITGIQAMGVETQATVGARQKVTATQICEGILAERRLEEFPQKLVPVSRMESLEAATTPVEKASMTASLYYCAVAAVESENPTRDLNQAKSWYAQAALLDDPYAFYSLGIIFIKWEKQEALGEILMQAAAAKGYYDARVYVGLEKEDY